MRFKILCSLVENTARYLRDNSDVVDDYDDDNDAKIGLKLLLNTFK